MNFYIANMHYNHQQIIDYEKRPFANANNMNQTFDSNWNKTVGEDDDVWIAGNWSFYWRPETIERRLSKMHGRKHLILGNHDSRYKVWTWQKMGFYSVHTACPVADEFLGVVWLVNDPETLTVKTTTILHGHRGLPKVAEENGTYLVNIGIDDWNYKPVTGLEIEGRLKRFKEGRRIQINKYEKKQPSPSQSLPII
jgi:calcineurin-like phosphoesterase family protein